MARGLLRHARTDHRELTEAAERAASDIWERYTALRARDGWTPETAQLYREHQQAHIVLRGLTATRTIVPKMTSVGRPAGVCIWCDRDTESKRTRWHHWCIGAYLIARGQTNIPAYKPKQKQLVSESPDRLYDYEWEQCEICGERAQELDHALALSVARFLGRRAILRAFWIDNLRWLCHDCHAVKTGSDRLRARSRPPPPMPLFEQSAP